MGRALRWVALGLIVTLLIAAGVAVGLQLNRRVPAPALRAEIASSVVVPGTATPLPLPASGQAALYLPGFGWLGSSPAEVPVPIASVTKIVTALIVLKAYPLSLGEAGPEVTVSASDVALYQSELEQGDSVVPVQVGESLSELQLLEGLLLPSGDNLAVLLADWVAGSEPSFVERMNQLATTLHLTDTHFADSSGLDSGSESSARDLVSLTILAMANPVFGATVDMPEVILPVAGTVHNYNPLLGQDGVVGVKTGWTVASLGCLVFAADTEVDGQKVQLIGAVLGQPGGPAGGLLEAARVTSALLAAAEPQLHSVSLAAPAQAVARVTSAWAKTISVVPTRTISLIALAGAHLHWRLRARLPHLPFASRSTVGTLRLTTPDGSTVVEPVVADRGLKQPSLWWRLTRRW